MYSCISIRNHREDYLSITGLRRILGQMTPSFSFPQMTRGIALIPAYLMLNQANRVCYLGTHHAVPLDGKMESDDNGSAAQ